MQAVIKQDVPLLLDLGLMSGLNKNKHIFALEKSGMTPMMLACAIGK